MKKRLAYGFLLLLACACSRVEQPAPPRTEVAFTTPAVGAATKAVTGELGATYDIHEDFLVWSWFSPADLTRADGTTDGRTAARPTVPPTSKKSGRTIPVPAWPTRTTGA